MRDEYFADKQKKKSRDKQMKCPVHEHVETLILIIFNTSWRGSAETPGARAATAENITAL